MQYELRISSRSRHIKIRVEHPDKVVVSAPPRTPQRMIDQFVAQSESWISTQLAKLKHKQQFGETADTLTIFGITYQKQITLASDRPIGIAIINKILTVNPVQLTDASTAAEIKRFLKSTAEKYIMPRTQQLAKTMGIAYGSITLRAQKTRWGSCSSQGNLNFNWRLVHCPTPVIDYVIIHELAHRRHMNHSDRFWQLVAQYDPEHRVHRGWLKRQGMALG